MQVVCRACSRNRYPLKYLKDRVAKVCDHCYAELRKRGESYFFPFRVSHWWRELWKEKLSWCASPSWMLYQVAHVSVGGSVSGACGSSSPRTPRASRPLSAVFQSLQPPSLWKSRKSTSTLNQVKYTSPYIIRASADSFVLDVNVVMISLSVKLVTFD